MLSAIPTRTSQLHRASRPQAPVPSPTNYPIAIAIAGRPSEPAKPEVVRSLDSDMTLAVATAVLAHHAALAVHGRDAAIADCPL